MVLMNIDGHDLTAPLCVHVYACYFQNILEVCHGHMYTHVTFRNILQMLLCSIDSRMNLCALFKSKLALTCLMSNSPAVQSN